MKVLIAEDDPVSRRILEKLLTNKGYTTVACDNGMQAWHLYQEGDFRLIISDWMMPGLLLFYFADGKNRQGEFFRSYGCRR